jgi:anti-anti-sigma factor
MSTAALPRPRTPASTPVPSRPVPDDTTRRLREPGQVLAVAGRLDVHTAADVRLALLDALADGAGDLVLDVAAVYAVDATGLGVLVGAHRRAGRLGRRLVLRDPSDALQRVLFLTRLERVLQVSRSVTET